MRAVDLTVQKKNEAAERVLAFFAQHEVTKESFADLNLSITLPLEAQFKESIARAASEHPSLLAASRAAADQIIELARRSEHLSLTDLDSRHSGIGAELGGVIFAELSRPSFRGTHH